MSWSGRVSGIGWMLSILLVVAVIVLEAGNDGASVFMNWVRALVPTLGWAACAASGALVAWKRPANPVGWLLLGTALIWVGGSAVESYILQPVTPAGAAIAGSLIDSAGWVTGLAAIGAILLLFPNGRPLSFRWSLVLVVFAASAGILALSLLLTPGPLASFPGLENPFGVLRLGAGVTVVSDVARIAFFAGFWAAVISVGFRFWRSDAVERQQLKWFGFGVLLMSAAFLLGGLSSLVGIDEAVFNTIALTLVTPPLAIAALQYRLWDLDLVVRDTITYGLLGATITAIYLGVVAGAGYLVGAGFGDSLLLIALATAVAAVLLQPIREATQRAAHKIVFAPPRKEDAESAEGRIAIRTLGTFRVERDGVPLGRRDWQSRKARQLLKILISRRGHPVHREELIEMLWPEESGSNLGNRLAVALSTVRSTLDPEKEYRGDHFVLSEDDAVRLALDRLDIDVERFLKVVESARSNGSEVEDDLANLYRGPFLPEDLYEDWAIPLREQARATWLAALRAAGARATSLDEEVDIHWKILAEDPWDEDSYQAIVRALRDAGRHGEARRVWRSYCSRMRELGLDPAPFEEC